MEAPAPVDPRTSPIQRLGSVLGLPECDDEALKDLELLRSLERKERK